MIKGKIVIITGGASGIGLATAQLFNKKGAHVIVLDYSNKINFLKKKYKNKKIRI